MNVVAGGGLVFNNTPHAHIFTGFIHCELNSNNSKILLILTMKLEIELLTVCISVTPATPSDPR